LSSSGDSVGIGNGQSRVDSTTTPLSDAHTAEREKLEEETYFRLYGAALLLIVLAIPMLLRKRADLQRIQHFHETLRGTERKILSLTQIQATYGEFLNGYPQHENEQPSDQPPGPKLRPDVVATRRQALLDLYAQGKGTAQRQRFSGMTKEEIELALGYEEFGSRSQPQQNGGEGNHQTPSPA
jgi:hypothetical protein